MPELTPEERHLRAQIANAAYWQTHDPQIEGQRLRRSKLAHYAHQVDPDGILPPDERERRARAAEREQILRMVYQRERARKARKQQATI